MSDLKNKIEKDINALHDILNSMQKSMEYNHDTSFDNFITNDMKVDASIRQIEICGEATKRLSENIKSKFKDIPWKELAGIRDRIIHNYDKVDDLIIWETIKKDFPVLSLRIQAIIRSLNLLKNTIPQVTQQSTHKHETENQIARKKDTIEEEDNTPSNFKGIKR